jgi:hypothetical protein
MALKSPTVILALPPEIIDMITDFLFDDKRALASMSLVCREFHPSARLHLFDTLTINASDPLVFLEIVSPIAPLVRRLDICVDTCEGDDIWPWFEAVLLRLSGFKHVTSLSLVNLFLWEEAGNRIRRDLFAGFSGMLELSFIACYFNDSADISRLVLPFPVLERLHFENVNVCRHLGPLDVVPCDVRVLSRLTSLNITGVHAPITNWFLSLGTISSIRILQIIDIWDHEYASVGRIISALAPSVRHLTLGFCEIAQGVSP